MESKKFTQQDVDLVKMALQINGIESSVKTINTKLDAEYVTKEQLALLERDVSLIQRIVYGVVSLILVSVVGGMVVFYINAVK